MNVWQFYRQCLKRATTSGWDAANTVSLLIGVAGGFVVWLIPQFEQNVEALIWFVPVGAFAVLFLFRVARAPYELWSESQQRLRTIQTDADQRVLNIREDAEERVRQSEEALREATRELQDYRNCQAIAEYLTKQNEYGVHKLLNVPPNNTDELKLWDQWVANWNEAIFVEMEKLGCTLHDINRVRTISRPEVMEGIAALPQVTSQDYRSRIHESLARMAAKARFDIDISVKMHDIRVRRVAEVATKYAGRADAIRLAATTRAESRAS